MFEEKRLVNQIYDRLKASGEWVYTRGRPDHPCFKSAEAAASKLMALYQTSNTILTMRDQCLRHVRTLVLGSGHELVVPDQDGLAAYSIPHEALDGPHYGKTGTLRINPLPRCARPYRGAVDLVVVGCLAFEVGQRRLYGFDTERTAGILEELDTGDAGIRIPDDVPFVAIAADCQQVEKWPEWALSHIEADVIITPTRIIRQ